MLELLTLVKGHSMKKAFNPELARAINQQAHILAAQSFAGIRGELQEWASVLLKEGKSHKETLRAIREAGLHHETPESYPPVNPDQYAQACAPAREAFENNQRKSKPCRKLTA